MYFNPYVGRSPNLSFFGIGPWAIIHGIGPKLAYSVIWPNFNTVDPMSKIFFGFLKPRKDLK